MIPPFLSLRNTFFLFISTLILYYTFSFLIRIFFLHFTFIVFCVHKKHSSQLNSNNLTCKDFAVFIKYNDIETNEEKYALRYEEFIALNTHMIQKLYKRIEELEKRIDNNQIIYTSNTYLYGISVKIGIGVIGGVTGISEGFLVTVAIGVTVATGLGVGASVRDRFKFCVNTKTDIRLIDSY